MKDFFISYASANRRWAEWIAWVIEEARYSVVLQAWDFLPGRNFVLAMHEASCTTRKTIVVLSEAYLLAEYTRPEWAAAFARDPAGERRMLIPVRVTPCDPDGLLKAVVFVDLVGLDVDQAKRALLAAISNDERTKPARQPPFPGARQPESPSGAPTYPG